MEKIISDRRYFSLKETLECGQMFRYVQTPGGYFVLSRDRACMAREEGDSTIIECCDGDGEYFRNFFDLGTDYAEINSRLAGMGYPVLTHAAERCRGLRLLRQDPDEMIISFIVSQNNNIPRIRTIINRMSSALGELKRFGDNAYYAFPKSSAMADAPESLYTSIGAGYRARYIKDMATAIARNETDIFPSLDTPELKKRLMSYPGIGPKVADCIALFGFHRLDSFPVDTWMEKVYREDFGGSGTDRVKMNAYFTSMFGDTAGIAQQYLFYCKRENL